VISTDDSDVLVLVLPTDEELSIARQALEVTRG
jgi:acetate kinase